MVDHLLDHMSQVRDINDWVLISGMEPDRFNKVSQHYFGQNAAYVLNYLRMLVIVEDFHQNPQNSLYLSAIKAGLCDEPKLNDFVEELLGISPLKLKEKVRNEDTYIKVVRLIMHYAGLEVNVQEILSQIMHNPSYA